MHVARIALSAATYWLDKPYDYNIPEHLADKVVPGVRVTVPFSRGNRAVEGFVLSISETTDYSELKSVASVKDDYPILDNTHIQLALWMRNRFFCTVYDSLKAMLPTGLLYNSSGRRQVADKYTEYVRLLISSEQAIQISIEKEKRAKSQSEILKLLSEVNEISLPELLDFTGASKQSVKTLVDKSYVEIVKEETFRRPFDFTVTNKQLPTLNVSQKEVFSEICKLTSDGNSHALLLQGITGSGKTSIYLHLIDNMLKLNKSSILLVPEIVLTPQMLSTFCSYFGDEVAVLHSKLSNCERYDEWKRIKNGDAKVVIGTRSAIFAPVKDLGLIIIDEEQEDSYKSENSPRYNAKDIAKFLCSKSNSVLLLGSATPDIESRYFAEIGRYNLLRLDERYNKTELPKVNIVDMKSELKSGNNSSISSYLKNELEANISKGEQSIIFLNRRGANKLISCGECGYIYSCPKCSVSLTYHTRGDKLMCHYCGYTIKPDKSCPECNGILNYLGTGTQKIEEELNNLFPNSEVIRMDTDTVNDNGGHEEILNKFVSEKIPILIGTQMVTKGLNLNNVTLIGVINADQSLYAGDYRAAERTFSLITQVIGRSGRGELPGRAIIQTYTPENETIVQASSQNYDKFYSTEIEMRKLQKMPPFVDVFAITVTGENESEVLKCCNGIKSVISKSFLIEEGAELLGPAPLNVLKVNNVYRYRLRIICKATNEIRNYISSVLVQFGKDKHYKNVYVYADNNPSD